MKRYGRLVLLAALAGSGCLALPPLWTDTKLEMPGVVDLDNTLPPPPVLPEQVNETNAQEMLNALRQELDYAAKEQPAALKPGPAPTKAKP